MACSMVNGIKNGLQFPSVVKYGAEFGNVSEVVGQYYIK